jgi:hypothetical protein
MTPPPPDSGELETARKDPQAGYGGDIQDRSASHEREGTDAPVTASASTAASTEPSAQEIANTSATEKENSAPWNDDNMPPPALRPVMARRFSGGSEDFADRNNNGGETLPDTAAALAIAGNRLSVESDHSHPSRRLSGDESDSSSRRASNLSSNGDPPRRGSGLVARMQRRLSNEGSVSMESFTSSRRNSDFDDARSRRSSTASKASRRTSGLLSWGKYVHITCIYAPLLSLPLFFMLYHLNSSSG